MNSTKSFIPNTLTLFNLMCGFVALLVNDLGVIVLLFCLSLLFDVLDGLIARMLNVQSDLGKELDSLADVVSFGVVPAFLYYKMAPEQIGWLSYVAPSLIVAASGYRLAKFNLLPSSNYFIGLNTPSNAIFFMGLFIAFNYEKELITSLLSNQWIYLLLPLFFSYLLNSPLKMFSLKGLSNKVLENKFHLALVGILIILIIIDPILAISGSVLVYLLLSLVMNFSK